MIDELVSGALKNSTVLCAESEASDGNLAVMTQMWSKRQEWYKLFSTWPNLSAS